MIGLSSITGLFTGQIWKLATAGAGVISMLLGVALTYTYVEMREIRHTQETTLSRINDPKTGYVVQLAQANTNNATLTFNLDQQNQVIKARSEADAKTLADVTAKLKAVQEDNKKKAAIIHQFALLPPQGKTLEDRYGDIDKRILENLK